MSASTDRSAEQLRELARLGFEELRDAAGGIRSVHHAIAERAFTLAGPQARPVKAMHDAISHGVYEGVRGVFGLGTRGAALAGRLGANAERELSATPRGAFLLATLNGLIGDVLEREASPLAEPMAVRVDGRPVALERDALAEAFPQARPRIVVFLHGLMETEFSWRLGALPPYGERLEDDLGVTAVFVRYNTGRHISENGRSLAELVDRLVAAWPEEVTEVALVGHSMGGLVARSACHQAKALAHEGLASEHGDIAAGETEPGMAWVDTVRHIVSLGSPHMGAPLEQVVHYASAGLHRFPETRPFARFLRRRSAGIRDLRQGSLVDEDWRDRDPDALEAAACAEVPLLDGATHCFVSATLTRSPKHPVGRLLGDVLVLPASASGRSRARRVGFRDEDGFHLGGASHFALLNHPEVYARLRDWLGTRRAVPAG